MAVDIDNKPAVEQTSDDIVVPTTEHRVHGKLEPPPLVAAMSQEYRLEAERKLRKKIDTRLLPMIILMYIMNYLDRNNIAAVRLAGLQDELNLTSTQYQVSLKSLRMWNCSLRSIARTDCHHRPPFRFCSWVTS